MEINEVRVKLYVADFDRRRAFYRDTLGWSIKTEWDEPIGRRGVMFGMGESILELLEDPSASEHESRVDLSLKTPDVWSLWTDLAERVQVKFALRDNSWGDTSFCIVDPGGFRITFFSPRDSGA